MMRLQARQDQGQVEEQHPLKQGLKHKSKTSKSKTSKVEEQHPLKQGLKLIFKL